MTGVSRNTQCPGEVSIKDCVGVERTDLDGIQISSRLGCGMCEVLCFVEVLNPIPCQYICM